MPRIPLVTEASMTDGATPGLWRHDERSAPFGTGGTAGRRHAPARPRREMVRTRPGAAVQFVPSPPRLREFVILLTGRFWDCQFEWFSHEAEARKAICMHETIEMLRRGGENSRRRMNRPFTTTRWNCCATTAPRTRHIGQMLDAYGVAGVVELTALIGYYAMIALTLNAHDIGVPESVIRRCRYLPTALGQNEPRQG